MKQIILIGFSTTGKSSLIKKIKRDIPTCTRDSFDTDEIISKDFNSSISNIFYQLGRDKALLEITQREVQIIDDLMYSSDNLIIAAGPGIPFHDNFKEYISIKKPHVILLEKSADNIYESLKNRRLELRGRLKEPRSDFGIWDIGVMVDENNIEFGKETAVAKINNLLRQRDPIYKSFAKFIFKTSEVLDDSKIPEEILNIL
ncbi:MAG TPA: shikimate kinase [Haliscomenobacter sp.]|uniref:shikimate kinase n=1 Tax=Haliscomenobacter sp. TaxID=2717303 RepID=UPI002C838EBA|nr:shikimate kinase [Haliscomenobacter sp.]HOY21269.1 shikimate kinase [Haliscomenobacter sp.]